MELEGEWGNGKNLWIIGQADLSELYLSTYLLCDLGPMAASSLPLSVAPPLTWLHTPPIPLAGPLAYLP